MGGLAVSENLYIGYDDVTVTQEQLTDLKAQQDAAEGIQKYYKFKAWLHYANLQRWQEQGHHYHYMSGPFSLYCTCGLTIFTDGRQFGVRGTRISDEVAEKLEHLNLSKVQMYRGHRDLPEMARETIAITVDYIEDEESDDFLWTVICQGCGDHVSEVHGAAAGAFEHLHNESCNKPNEKSL